DDEPTRFPDAVLFNGGVFNSAFVRAHLKTMFSRWRGEDVVELANASPDTAVALGAVVHAMALRGSFTQITGGSPRHYFLLTEDEAGAPVGICLLPKGTPEVRPIRLEHRRFRLA